MDTNAVVSVSCELELYHLALTMSYDLDVEQVFRFVVMLNENVADLGFTEQLEAYFKDEMDQARKRITENGTVVDARP